MERDPLWYQDAIIYELHVRAYADSNGDGIGDFPGLTSKLDYLKDLGVTAIWLLPFYPSPLRDDGYDVSDYTGVHPAYGTLADVRRFVREAHRRGLRVITELVCNHTSDQHPWFQRARKSPPGSVWRRFYVWSDTASRYKDARIIFKDFETSNWTWDPVAKAFYWHRFYSHQPDLNFAEPRVRAAIRRVLDFWLQLGVDGLRLDAVPYLFERDGTDCENLPETHAYLQELRRYVDERYEDRMLLAEANQWPDQAALYFGQGDECNMAFHFPLMPRLFMALRLEDRFPITDILTQTPEIPETAQWVLFLRNHDELTLEMVTEEEREYLWDAYAGDPQARINLGIRRRLAPLLGNHRRRIELMSALLFSLPGTPEIYYGDEIGMGDNIYLGDRNAVRTPMQWRGDLNAGFSAGSRQRLYLPVVVDPEYHFETVNVETQANNPSSLLHWTRRILALRSRHKAFGRGRLVMLEPDNRKVLAFVREHDAERILVVCNLSRFAQAVSLDLLPFQGSVPVEMFGHGRFPAVGPDPYFLSLGPHTFFWFLLEPAPEAAAPGAELVRVAGTWPGVLTSPGLKRLLPEHLHAQRWFAAKSRRITDASVVDTVPLGPACSLAVVRVAYADGDPETYALPLAVAAEAPEGAASMARLAGDGVIFDALSDAGACEQLLAAVVGRRRMRGALAALAGAPTPAWRKVGPTGGLPQARAAHAEQSNSSVRFGERLILKIYRRLQPGVQPEVELGRYLYERAGFRHIAPVLGTLVYGGNQTLGVVQAFVPNQGDGWSHALARLQALLAGEEPRPVPPAEDPLTLALSGASPDPAVGDYPAAAGLLGRRTAEMHLALLAAEEPALAPEAFTSFAQRAVFEGRRAQLAQTEQMLRAARSPFPGAAELAARLPEVLLRYRAVAEHPQVALRIRCHGDYHLGQVLVADGDFIIIDFEGEPARSLADRRRKSGALRDVAGMVRSLHYAAMTAIRAGGDEQTAFAWYRWSAAAFLQGYLAAAGSAPFLPQEPAELRCSLQANLLEKVLYELRYELNHRPDWVDIPAAGLREHLAW
ncbi:MAG TPA: maltose alpha-D-glucosyltransferase [Bacillota bacterium]|nr:maltose alpha-D-glucosyltransferase [Bacillota bacterium]